MTKAETEHFRLTKTRIREGVWEGQLRRLDGADGPAPRLEARHLDRVLDGLTVEPDRANSGLWAVRLPIPAEILCDGVQTVAVLDADTGERLSDFTLVTGEPLEDDIRAEVDLLRAELDMLKRAFRRHCTETA